MQNEKLFMKMLQEIVEIAKVNGNSITTDEVDEYFSELELNEKQVEAIYDYLCKGHIKVVGYTHISSDDNNEPVKKEDANEQYTSDKDIIDSARTKHYRKTVKDMGNGGYSVDEIYEKISGDCDKEEMRNIIINTYLPVVLNYASRYAGRAVASDELIQEGNLALILAVDKVLSKNERQAFDNVKKFDSYIRNEIRTAIIKIIDNEIEDESELQTAVGKAQLVKEAAAHLSKELGRVASLKELSEFTHIAEDEIEDIIRFSGNVVSLGDGNDMSKQ